MAFIIETLYVLFAVAFLFVLYMKWNRQYWAKRNVPGIDSNLIWGNIRNPLTGKNNLIISIQILYDEFKQRGDKHGGIYLFMNPVYMPISPELIKQIMSRDFQHFTGHGVPINKEKEPLTAHLFNLDGEEWRNMRVQLTPTFTSGKMKMMFNTLLECGGPMIQYIEDLSRTDEPLDIKDILSCYTTDVIGSCAFGIECNSFKDPDADFRKHGREIFKPRFSTILLQLTAFIMPSIRKYIHIRIIPEEVEAFFKNAIKSILGYRESNNFKRNDFVQLLIELNEKAKANGKEVLTLNEIAAQSFVFFVAGFETSSTTMTFCMHELAFNQNIQDTLRREIRESLKKYDGKLTYEGIMEMQYMDKVINETLRKYPPVGIINRVCNKTYIVPNTDTVIEEGTRLFISVLGLHRDEEYYPNPKIFDPERFSEENKVKRHPYTFLPFGEGPRMCIGLRFGVMQAKTGLAMLLNNYKILPAKGEIYDFELDPRSFITTKKGGVMLKAVKLD